MNQPENTVIDRIVRCPSCGGDSMYGPNNEARPFCSTRCKNVDLGAWANEDFRVATTAGTDDAESAQPLLQ